LVYVARELRPDGTLASSPKFRDVTPAKLRDLASHTFEAQRITKVKTKQGESVETTVPIKIPDDVIKGALERGYFKKIPVATNIIEYPVMRADGSILSQIGHDPQTGLVMVHSGKFLPVDEAPTIDDARESMRSLLGLFSDFPFAESHHLSCAVASILTLHARPAIDGCVPMFMVEASTRGTGKSKLVDVVSRIVTGRDASKSPYSEEQEEMRKSYGSILAEGQSIACLDNVKRVIGDPTLDLLLTSRIYSDRVLGSSERCTYQNETVYFATANNPTYAGDTARRTLPIRLESKHEKPEERQDFEHPDILSFVTSKRAEFVRDALTILRAWYIAGRPQCGARTWGSFEAWSSIVPSIFRWLGLPDPMDARTAVEETADPMRNALAVALAGWQQIDRTGQGYTVNAMLKELASEAPILSDELKESMREALEVLAPGRGIDKIDARKLGMEIQRARGRVIHGLTFADAGASHGSKRWKVVRVEAKAMPPSAPAPAPKPAEQPPPPPVTRACKCGAALPTGANECTACYQLRWMTYAQAQTQSDGADPWDT
jgi:putative DNA primase/helicase